MLSLLAGIGFLALIAQTVAWWLRLPAILFLLLSGIVVGPVLGLLDPDALFGDLLFPIVSLAVAVILFEGALTLRFSELSEVGSTVTNLVTIGALVTWGVTSVAAHYLIGFDMKLAFLFGALVVVTGPTVIVPMLRTVRPNSRISRVLRWEGIVIDPLGALLAVLAFDVYISAANGGTYGHVAWVFGQIVLVGTVLGIVAGFALGWLLRQHLIPEYLRSVMTLLVVFVVFALSEAVHHESGLLAVTLFGITLTNLKGVEIEDILDFKESLSVLLISGLFILLAARIDVSGILAVGAPAIYLLLVIMLVARPLSVLVSSLGSSLTWQERTLIAWIGPRGIVCAAVAALFALKLEAEGVSEAALMVPLAFMVIIGTVVIQSVTAKPLAHYLGVRDPAPAGVLIVGAGTVARAIARALQEQDVRVLVTDSDYANIRDARMDELEVYFGNPVSEHADRHLDLTGIGRVFAMSGRPYFDALASVTFGPIFGPKSTYELAISASAELTRKHQISSRHRGSQLFGDRINYSQLAGQLRHGGQIKTTALTEAFDYQNWCDSNPGATPLFGFDPDGRLQIIVDDEDVPTGWRLVALVPGVLHDE
ncbi:MAG: sodium:proton antiporter [Pseudomonadota bacterium]